MVVENSDGDDEVEMVVVEVDVGDDGVEMVVEVWCC